MKSLMQRLAMGATCSMALALTLSAPVSAAGDPAEGAKKAYTCLGCHGVEHYVNAYPTYKVPRIAGQHEAYLVAALQAYRGKTRHHPTMQANAGLLSDQDIADISAYLASQGK
jgi:cytochrome c553